MAQHFEIKINVAYDIATLPEDMLIHLVDNVRRCVECAELLNDSDLEAVIEEWDFEVHEK